MNHLLHRYTRRAVRWLAKTNWLTNLSDEEIARAAIALPISSNLICFLRLDVTPPYCRRVSVEQAGNLCRNLLDEAYRVGALDLIASADRHVHEICSMLGKSSQHLRVAVACLQSQYEAHYEERNPA